METRTASLKSVLLLIDIQEAFTESSYWGPSRSNPGFEKNVSAVIKTYRSLAAADPAQHKIIHVAHASKNPVSPLFPSKSGFAFQPFAAPSGGELVIRKTVNSAFIGTDLEGVIRSHFSGGPGFLFLAGLTTDHCVSTTTRMAGNLEVCDGKDGKKGEVLLIEDATAAWKKGEGQEWFDAEIVHKVHTESLEEFATICKTSETLDKWNSWLVSE